MRGSGGNRIEWIDIDADVRAEVERVLDAAVVAAENQPGGFSPGLAARTLLDDGRRVFVKAVSPDQNEHACRIHRREAEVARTLPDQVAAPRLLHVVDDGRWVVLLFEEVDGRPPREPWRADELDVVVPALQRHLDAVTPAPDPTLQAFADRHRPVFGGLARLAGGDGEVDAVHPWVRAHLEVLADIEAGWPAASVGTTLVHADLRADNLLLGDDGGVVIVDWPWACIGAAWCDLALFLPSVGLGGGPPPPVVSERHGLFVDVEPERLHALVAAVAGFFLRAGLDPPPPGLPTVRAFQRAQADVAVDWLRALRPDLRP